jgi:hypothetical protein
VALPSPTLEPVALFVEERSVLTGWVRRRKAVQVLVQVLVLRSRIVLC